MKLQLAAPADFSFLECVNAHGWKSLLPFSWDAEALSLTRVQQFADRDPGLVSIRSEGDVIAVEIDNETSEQEAVWMVSRILQLDVPMADFHSYCSSHETLHGVPASRQGRLLRSPTVYEDILKVVATTNTTWTQTRAMVERIVNGFGAPLTSDPARHAFPTPEQIASASPEYFAEVARMGYRNGSVHKISTDIAEGRLNVESWCDPSIPSNDLYKQLLSLPGIGPYAASCLMIYLGRYDRVNVDSWARTLVGRELGSKVTDKEVHAFFEPYGRWKALAYHFYPWQENPAIIGE